ncbi:MAG: DUF72 domain-containing protein [Chitinophagales bacterium]|nr:DUF72 domain-containing protein [Chitinophagales bacterium]
MKFGHAEQDELKNVDFSLSDDRPETTQLLAKLPKEMKQKLFVGCGKWGIKEWIGDIYPEGTKEKDFLVSYKDIFDSIELNNTFYRLSRSAIESWAETVKGSSFEFCPKWSRRVSHMKRLNDAEENTQYFINSCLLFGDSLGCTFLQLPENFATKNFERIEPFLKLLPKGFPVQIELRHAEWFEENMFTEIGQLFEKYNVGWVITDTALRRDAVHQRLTNDTAFIRFNGYSLHDSDYKRMDAWIEKIGEWFDQGLSKCYFFCHQKDEKNSPATCRYFIERANEELNMQLKVPPSY